MKISWNWLNDFVNLHGIAPEDVAERLTNAGLEVEEVERRGAAFSGVIVARIMAVDPHPNADKLRLVTVNTGANETMQVVCGAPNVRPNSTIAYAPLGASVLNRKDGGRFTLGEATIRGVVSKGMICSLDELGLTERYSQDEDGIWVIPEAVLDMPQLGQLLIEALGLPTDAILHTAPTANRGDQMCHVGVAREVAALTERTVTLKPPTIAAPTAPLSNWSVALDDPTVCQYYAGALLEGITIGPSPAWLAARVEAAGMRSINTLVDVTNYIMLAYGQPLHAFDASKLDANDASVAIGVRRATEGETLVTLDDETRLLTNESIVITANNQPEALAGVMGGQTTAITDATTHLFLEAAVFPTATTRRSAKSVGLRTEASARFERGVDATVCREALFKAIELLQQLANEAGQTIPNWVGLVETTPPMADTTPITLRLDGMATLLGITISEEESTRILSTLGFNIAKGEQNTLKVTVPSYRSTDVTREIDLIEEIIRITGYGDIPESLPLHTQALRASKRQQALNKLHTVLRGAGLNEIMTNSLLGPEVLEKTATHWPEAQQVVISNAHSPEHTLLRQSLLPNLLLAAQHNAAQGQPNVPVYELGRVYERRGKATEKATGVVERRALGALLMGDLITGRWQSDMPMRAANFYDLKGITEQVLAAFGIAVRFESILDKPELYPSLHPGQSAKIVTKSGGKTLGTLGQLHPALAETLKFRQTVWVLEMDVEQLLKLSAQQTANAEPFEPSPYPAVSRDVAFVAPNSVSHQQLVDAIAALNDPSITGWTVFDEYRGEHIETGHRSLAYRLTLQHQEKTLTDADIQTATDRVKHALSHHCSVTFR
ncbi:MAG: phenylalanine--tRNA ligase subunit beta [Vampirovibrionales bacterium]|nr:phenylalanine--tRNA ligase subunit beta [Vampirovibrionales bacterium]